MFPSFVEGFGFPPVEAMVCGTPSFVSDLSVHRWVMEEAILYADPYNTGETTAQIERLVYGDDREAPRAIVREKALRVLARYNRRTVAAQWNNLFDQLRRVGSRR